MELLKIITMAKKNSERPSAMQGLVNGYNKMMEDPKEYANTTYKSQINKQGRAWGKWNGRDTTDKTVKPWPKGNIPV